MAAFSGPFCFLFSGCFKVFEKREANRTKATRVFETQGAHRSKRTRVFSSEHTAPDELEYLRKQQANRSKGIT